MKQRGSCYKAGSKRKRGWDRRSQVEAGVFMVADALAWVEQTGVRWYEAETCGIKGAPLLHQADPDAAEAAACFQQALALARHQDAYDLLAPV
jgi:hypothetical protein